MSEHTAERANGCECVGYTIRTDYGTGTEHDVDQSSCPIHGDPEPTVDDRAVRLAAEVGRLTVEVERLRGELTPDETVAIEAAAWVARVERERDEARATVARVEAAIEALEAKGCDWHWHSTSRSAWLGAARDVRSALTAADV